MSKRLSSFLARLTGAPRLVLAAVLLIAGGVCAVAAASPTATAAVVVVVRDLAAGQILTSADLRGEHRPPSEVPARAVADAATVTGDRVVGAVARGEVLTSARVVTGAFAAAVGAGRSIAVVSVSPGAARVVVPGDRVDLTVARSPPDGLSTSNNAVTAAPVAVVVASFADVLAVWPNTQSTDTATVVAAVSVTEASGLSVLAQDVVVGVITRGP